MVFPATYQDLEDSKFDILHICRLCERLLDEARNAEKIAGMKRTWRCATFDRALTRYYRRWLSSREEYVEAFWAEFGEEEFKADVLKRSSYFDR